MAVDGVSMLGLILFIVLYLLIGMCGLNILEYEKNNTDISNYSVISAVVFFSIWIILWLLNSAGAFLFWTFQSQSTNEKPNLNPGIYSSGIIMYLITYGFSILYILVLMRAVWFKDKIDRYSKAFLIAIFLFIFDAVTIGLFFSICKTPGDELSHGYCWVPGFLNTFYLIFTIYILYISYCLSECLPSSSDEK